MNTRKPELSELNQEELLLIDGGFTAEQWIVGTCTVFGAIAGTVLGGGICSVVGVKAGSAVGIGICSTVGIATSIMGNGIGNAIIN